MKNINSFTNLSSHDALSSNWILPPSARSFWFKTILAFCLILAVGNNAWAQITSTLPASVCTSNATAYNLTAAPCATGTAGIWSITPTPTPGFTMGVPNFSTATFNPSLAGVGMYIIKYTCPSGLSFTRPVTVIGSTTPVIIPTSQTICSGLPTEIALYELNVTPGTTFSWTAVGTGAVAGFSAGSGASIAQTLTNPGSAVETVTYTVTSSAGGCAGNTANVIVTVNPIPDATATQTPAAPICSGLPTNVVLANPNAVAGTSYTWTAANTTPTASGFAAGAGAGPITDVLVNTGAASAVVTYTVTPTANGCPGTPVTATVTVNPAPKLVVSPDVTLCTGGITNVTFTDQLAGSTYAWTSVSSAATLTGNAASGTTSPIMNTLTNSGTTVETVTYTITPTGANTCVGMPVSVVITVNPIPTLVATPSVTPICSGQSVNIVLVPTPASPGITYDWASAVTGALTGNTNAVGNSSPIADIIINSGIIPGTVTYNITPKLGTCVGTPVAATLTVNPKPVAAATPVTQTVCTAIPFTPIMLTETTGLAGTTTFNWTASGSSANVTGFTATGGSGTPIAETLVNTGTVDETVTYTITPTADVTDGSCVGNPIIVTVTVHPSPAATATPTTQSVCSGIPSAPIVLSDVLTGTTYTWTSAAAGTATGNNASGMGSPIIQTLTNTGAIDATVTYTITPMSAFGCVGNPITATITVRPFPAAIAVAAAQFVCSGVASAPIVLSDSKAVLGATTYAWTSAVTAGTATGNTSGSVSPIVQTLTNTTNANATVTYTITPTSAFGCVGTPTTATIIVRPFPAAVAAPAAQFVCSGVASAPIVLSDSKAVPGVTTYAWTSAVTAGAATGNTTPGMGSPIVQTLTNTGTVNATVTYTITPKSEFGCIGTPTTAAITVRPVPNVIATPAAQVICSVTATNIQLTSAIAGTTFNWTAALTSGSATGFSAGSGSTIAQILTNTSTTVNAVVTYTVTPTLNGCPGLPITVAVTIGAPKLPNCFNVNVSIRGTCMDTLTPRTVSVIDTSLAGLYSLVLSNGGVIIPNNIITFANVGQTLTAQVFNNCSGNSCWANVKVEDKTPPTITCPANVSIYCGQDTTIFALGNATATDCSGIRSVIHSDFIAGSFCSPTNSIFRTFIATDNSGYTASCVQTITVNRPLINQSLVYINNDTLYNCSANTTPTFTGYPQLLIPTSNTPPYGTTANPYIDTTDLRPNTYCNVNVVYSDVVDTLCSANTKKIARTWLIQDACANTWVILNQLIIVLDTVPPVINVLQTDTLRATSSFNSCSAFVTIPNVLVVDGCSKISSISASVVLIRQPLLPDSTLVTVNLMGNSGTTNTSIPAGNYTIVYRATDGCGNFSTATRPLQVRDLTQPVAICRQNTSISLTTADTSHVLANVFDEGSFDNCCLSNVFQVRRMAGETDADFKPFINFTCRDIGNSMIILRVVDCSGNSNICMVNAIVEDKVAPTITAPPSVTVDCGSYILQSNPGLTVPFLNANFGTVVTNGQTQNPVLVNIYEIPAVNSGVNVGLDGVASDNCTVSVSQTFTSTVTSCGIGVLTRTFTATDGGGRTATATQTITVQNSRPFYINDIDATNADATDGVIWPRDTTITSSNCLAGDLSPNVTGRPVIISGSCDQIFVGVESDTFRLVQNINNPAAPCYKILRTWKVIDWCQANIPGSTFRWTYTQAIKVIDNSAPVFATVLEDTIVNILDANCSATLQLIRPIAIDCSPVVTVTVSSNLGAGGATVSGYGPFTIGAGRYTVTYTAQDGCGNATTMSRVITVRDGKKPTPVCFVATTALMMPPACMVRLDSAHFNNNSFDNCTSNSNLRIRLELAYQRSANPNYNPSLPVSSTNAPCLAPINPVPVSTNPLSLPTFVNIFPCDLVQGIANVRMYVIDQAGNFDYCQTQVAVTNFNGCTPTSLTAANIAGLVQTEMGDNVEQVKVNVTSNSNSFFTGPSGVFSFLGLPTGSSYTVTPEKDLNPVNGVTTYDLVLISRHILGVAPLSSPYKIIAADINKSGTVTTFDMVQLRKLILHLDDNFTDNTSWRFVDKHFVFPDPSNPFASIFPEVMSVSNLDHDMQSDFVGIKIGDVNNSATPNSLLGTEEHNAVGTFHLTTAEKMLKAGETYTIDFRGEAVPTVQGYQFTLNFDKTAINFIDLKTNYSSLSKENFGLSLLSEGAITASWNGNQALDFNAHKEALFSIVVRANTDISLSRALSLNSRYTAAEAYNQNTDLLDMDLQFQHRDGSNSTANGFELYQNEPNPFQENTTIGFNLPESGEATLTIFDTDGKTLYAVKGDFGKGYNAFKINKNDLSANGKLLYYQLRSAASTATRKMTITN